MSLPSIWRMFTTNSKTSRGVRKLGGDSCSGTIAILGFIVSKLVKVSKLNTSALPFDDFS